MARAAACPLARPRHNIGGMTTIRQGRREFLKSSLSTAAIASAWPRGLAADPTPAAPPRPARLRFAAIGLNHGHINGQVASVIRGGGELVSFFAIEPDLIAALQQAVSAGAPRPQSARDPRRLLDRARGQRLDCKGARAAGHRSHAPRQGLHGRQAWHHHARPTGRSPEGPGRDQAHLLDSLQRTPREPRHRARRRAGEGRRDRQGRADHRAGAAPHEPEDSAGVVLRPRQLRRHPVRHRVAPVRPVPVLHRVDRGRGRRLAGAQRQPPAVPGARGLRRRDGAWQRRHRLRASGLVHSRWPEHLGRRPAHGAGHRRLHRDPQERGHRRPSRRQPPVSGRPEGNARRRLQRRRAAVRRAPGRRRAQSDGDVDATGARVSGDRAGAEGSEAGESEASHSSDDENHPGRSVQVRSRCVPAGARRGGRQP